MIKAVLFDLDGTLLPLDMDEFLTRYIPSLWQRLSGRTPLREFAQRLMSSTQKMIDNDDPTRTLEKVFWEDFASSMGESADRLLPVAADFYETGFKELRGSIVPNPAAQRALDAALAGGYRIALATNPIFPEAAVIERMRWAGLDVYEWELITSYEDSHFAKPNTRYYSEIAKSLGLQPQECIMVGNDTRDDLVASQIGMKTFLVTTGFHIERHDGYPADWRGSFDELTMLIRSRFAQ